MTVTPLIEMSTFAAGRHRKGSGYAYFLGSDQELIERVRTHWAERLPGEGRTNLDEVVLVPVSPEGFMSTTVAITDHLKLHATWTRRREHEEPYVRVAAEGPAEPARFVKVVLYSKDVLAATDERSTNADWEIVSLIAGPVADEPMDPVSMARNMLGKVGGSRVDYSAEQLLRAIWFWSQHTKVRDG